MHVANVIAAGQFGDDAAIGGVHVVLAVDGAGTATVCGQTRSSDYPTVAGSYDTTPNGFADGFVTRIAPGSVFKLVTALAHLHQGGTLQHTESCGQRGRVRPGLRYRCDGLHNDISLDK